jgi:hypothetical protein
MLVHGLPDGGGLVVFPPLKKIESGFGKLLSPDHQSFSRISSPACEAIEALGDPSKDMWWKSQSRLVPNRSGGAGLRRSESQRRNFPPKRGHLSFPQIR